jgi:hypothetical protein
VPFVFFLQLGSYFMAEHEFKLDTTFTGRNKSYARPIGVVVAILGVVIIVLSLKTDFPSRLLPLDENYLAVLIPKASDGGTPLALTALTHSGTGETVDVSGTVENRTDVDIVDLRAVIQPTDLQGLLMTPLEVPFDPATLKAHGSGTFAATLTGKPANIVVKFRLADGPFVPHTTSSAPR